MTVINPPPQNIPQEMRNDFIQRLVNCISTIFSAVGGKDGVPRIFRVADTPTSDPGWASSSTVNMTPPDGYLKAKDASGNDVVIPFWNT